MNGYQPRDALTIFRFKLAIDIPKGGLITYRTIIIGNFGYSSQTSVLLTKPTGVMARRLLFQLARCLIAQPPRSDNHALGCLATAGERAGMFTKGQRKKPDGPSVCTFLSPKHRPCFARASPSLNTDIKPLGPQTLRKNRTPAYTGGVSTMQTCYYAFISIVDTYCLACAWQNRARDRR